MSPPTREWFGCIVSGPTYPPMLPLQNSFLFPILSSVQLVEQFAEEAGVAFLPKPGRTHEGLQVRTAGQKLHCVRRHRGTMSAAAASLRALATSA